MWCHRRSGCGVPMFHNCAHTSDLWTGQQDWLSGVADVPPSVQAIPRWFTSPLCPPPYQPSTASITGCGLCSLQGWSLMMEWVCLLQRATPLCPLSMLINAVHWWGGGGGSVGFIIASTAGQSMTDHPVKGTTPSQICMNSSTHVHYDWESNQMHYHLISIN